MRALTTLSFVLLGSLLVSPVVTNVGAADPPNVLFISIDDLRPELGCYGKEMIHSPNIDRLAESGTLFERSYCMVAVCGASRASLMTGIRPARNRFRGYKCYAMKDAPDSVPLNTHFKNHGYYTLNNGKVYHHAKDHNDGWSKSAWRPPGIGPGRGNHALPENQKRIEETGNPRGIPWECAEVDDSLYKDGITADKSIEDLRRLADQEKPFFFAVGFVRPHLPFNAPKKYWDLYSREEIELPENLRYTPKNAPDASIHNFGELRAYIDVPKKGQLSDEMAKSLIHGYYACVSYTDAHVGRLLDELEKLGIEDETIVVLWGDHGWNLGEHTLWCKHCVYETSMQAPLIIRAPGMPENNRVASLVEFIDIYPTLCELADLPLPEHLQGRSLVPLLKDSGAVWKDAAVGRYGIGETIRTDRYRYSEFLDKQGDLIGRMLYDHREDPRENVNIVDRPEHEKLVKYLAEQLDARKGK